VSSAVVRRPGQLRSAFSHLPEHRQGLIAVLTAALLWSSGGLFIKWVSLDALAITMWRSLFALATVALLMRPGWQPPHRADKTTWAIALSYAATLLMFVAATRLTTAASAIFLQYTAPLYLLIFGSLLLHERTTRLDVATVGIAFCGMALFFVGKLDTHSAAGNSLGLASGITLAAMFLFLRSPACGPSTRAHAMVLGNLLLLVGLIGVNLARRDPALFEPGPGDLAALVFLGVVQIGIAYAAFTFGIGRVGALEASLIGMLEPVLNPVWVFLVLGETPGWWAVLGGTIIIAAVAARAWRTERGGTVGGLPVPILAGAEP
jgi:drug/metabolite transporter, DME family